MVPNVGTKGYHGKELPVPRPWNGSQRGNQRLPLQGIAGSQKLEFMFSKLSNYHCKELRIPKVWNSWFQAWKSKRYQWKDLLIPKR